MKTYIIEIKDKGIEFHKLSNMHREMSKLEYNALVQSIDDIGQQVPIMIYRGKIVDGRHRYKAILQLNIDKIECIEIPRNTTIQEVEEIIMSSENRRTDTPAQKAIRAYYWMQKDLGRTAKEASDKFGIRSEDISRLKKLINMIGSREINFMFEHGYVKWRGKSYSNIRSLYNIVKKDMEPTQLQKKEQEPTESETLEAYKLINSLRGNLIELAKIKTYVVNMIDKSND